jgi:hypothetical protein
MESKDWDHHQTLDDVDVAKRGDGSRMERAIAFEAASEVTGLSTPLVNYEPRETGCMSAGGAKHALQTDSAAMLGPPGGSFNGCHRFISVSDRCA